MLKILILSICALLSACSIVVTNAPSSLGNCIRRSPRADAPEMGKAARRRPFDRAGWFFLERLDVVRLQALRTALHLELDFLPFLEGLEAGHLDRGVMREQILAALARGDEAEAFGVVEPLYGTGCHLLFPVQIAATNPGATKPGTKYQE